MGHPGGKTAHAGLLFGLNDLGLAGKALAADGCHHILKRLL